MCYEDVCRTTTCLRFYICDMMRHATDILAAIKLLRRFGKVGFIGPLSIRMPESIAEGVTNAKELGQLLKYTKCLKTTCNKLRRLMYGDSTSWVHFPILMARNTYC